MNIFTICPKCKKDVALKKYKYFNDRGEIAKEERKKEIHIRCNKCDASSYIHVNSIKAKQNLTVKLVLFFTAIISSVIIFLFIKNHTMNPKAYIVIAIPWLFYFTFEMHQKNTTNNFNNYIV